MAPAQVEAALKRGAHVIALTEVHVRTAPQLARLASEYGYHWLHGQDDTALMVSAKVGNVTNLSTRHYTAARFTFHGHNVTVFALHWETAIVAHKAHREALTAEVLPAMQQASAGRDIVFYMGDGNPNKPLTDPSGYPRSALDAAGFPLVYEDLNDWPAHIGVNLIGHAANDTRVEPVSVETFDPLGSDHIPAQATYRVH